MKEWLRKINATPSGATYYFFASYLHIYQLIVTHEIVSTLVGGASKATLARGFCTVHSTSGSKFVTMVITFDHENCCTTDDQLEN